MNATIWAVVIGVAAAGLLLAAGYLIGLARGNRARDFLTHRLRAQDSALRTQVQELALSLQQHEATQRLLETDMKHYLQRLSEVPADTNRIRDDLERMLAPVIARDRQDGDLQTAVQELLGPIVERERLGYDLAHLELGTGERGELPRLLDDIAERGGFGTVLLSDDAGLPLAASHGSQDLERLTGVCSLVMLVADRLVRDPGPSPLALIVHDEANQQLLSRLFTVADQRLLLTAVATGADLSPTALDPTLGKIEAVLAPTSVD